MLNRLLHWRSLFVLLALAIIGSTVWYTRYVAGKIIAEERQRVEEWVEANRLMQQSDNPTAISLANLVIVDNEDMPLIATDEQNRVVDHRNLDSAAIAADSTYLYRQLERLQAENQPIDWVISDSPRLLYKVYYGNTRLLTEVQYYPLVQLLVVAIFVALLLALLRTQSRSTQNQLWAGLAKETAHQMGTPITSLRGWVEMLREQQVNPELVAELEKDVDRLKLVSDRFAKIGSAPQLEPTDLSALVSDMVAYMRRRAPGSINFVWQPPAGQWQVRLSATLVNWVLENLLKNALDAMDGAGSITLQLESNGQQVWLDVTDTGKGIAAAHLGRVFAPGFTTKKRGWGLGLTLSKRIVEQYHGGQLFVKHSEPGVGTTFRMLLPIGLV